MTTRGEQGSCRGSGGGGFDVAERSWMGVLIGHVSFSSDGRATEGQMDSQGSLELSYERSKRIGLAQLTLIALLLGGSL